MTEGPELLLEHYSHRPVELDRSRTYPGGKREPWNDKPDGLWVSVSGDQDWPAWCRSEEYALGRLRWAHRVVLADEAKVLSISSPEQLDIFTHEYALDDGYAKLTPYGSIRWGIDWAGVACQYDGIIIAPYQPHRRYSLNWYYGWDCASGCIWNLNAIADFVCEADHG